MHQRVQHFADVLHALGVHGSVRELTSSTRTAAEAAAALGCPVGAIANSLVFVADDEPVLALASGAHRVDTELLAAAFAAARCRRATPDEVRQATGQPIGGVSPVGHPSGLRAVIDVSLRAHPTLWAAAGTPNAVFETTYDELRRLAGATEATIAAG